MSSKVENRKLPFLIQKAQSKLINVIKWEKGQVNYLAAFHGMLTEQKINVMDNLHVNFAFDPSQALILMISDYN